MPLVTTTEMFKKAYAGGYAVGAFNVNNMEIIQGIIDAAEEEQAPVILQVSAGARKYAKHIYLTKLVEAAVADAGDVPLALHLDHGADFDVCKSCVDGGFTSVMAAIVWSTVGDIAPADSVGVAGGVFNFIGNMAGIITPIVIGLIVQTTGSFVGAMLQSVRSC